MGWFSGWRRTADPSDVAPDVAARTLATFRVVDVRQPDELSGPLGHVPGAVLVPLETLATAAAGWPRDARLLVVCRSGGRSARATAWLRGEGFAGAFNLVGGMMAWNAAGLPTCRQAGPHRCD